MQRERYFDAKRFRSREIYYQLELGWLNNRKVRRLRTLENPANIDAGLSISTGEARTVTDKATCRGVIAACIYRRYRMAGGECDDQVTFAGEIRATADEQRASAFLDDRRETGIYFAFAASFQGNDASSKRTTRRLRISQLDLLFD